MIEHDHSKNSTQLTNKIETNIQ